MERVDLNADHGGNLEVQESFRCPGGFFLGNTERAMYGHFDRASAVELRDFLTKIIDASAQRLPTAVGSRIRITDTDPLVRGKDEVFEATLMIDAHATTPERKVFAVTSVDGKPADSFLTFQAPSPSMPEPTWAFGKGTEYRWEVLHDAGAEDNAG